MKIAGALVMLLTVACSGATPPTPNATPIDIPVTPQAGHSSPATATPSASLPTLPEDGPLEPGRYRSEIGEYTCENPPVCTEETGPARTLFFEITVPGGYATFGGFPLISVDSTSGTNGPDGGALVLGWSNSGVGLYSDPCRGTDFEAPDIAVGPTVDDFVESVQAHPELDITEPEVVELGDFGGKLFTLTGPSDISGCETWQPWDPGFYVQGEDNRWDVWVIDADGFRVMIVAEYFPATPDEIRAELREMAESIRFMP
jgi:hypothetical protein